MFSRLCRFQAALFLSLAVYFLPLAASALENEDPALEQVQQLPSMAGYFFRAAVSLAIILVLTYLVIKVIKKQQVIQQRSERAGREWIRVFDYYSLGVNRGIYLAQIFSGIYVIAVSDSHVSILKEIDPAGEDWQSIRENLEKSGEPTYSGLSQRIKDYLKRFSRKNFKTELEDSLNREITDQLERTQRLHRHVTQGGGGSE